MNSTQELYLYSSVAVLIICLASVVGIFILPLLSKRSYNYVMVCFIGLAVGSLAGDALIHLIPTGLGVHSHDHDDHHESHKENETGSKDHEEDHDHNHEAIPEYIWYQLCVLVAIFVMFLFETLMNIICNKTKISPTNDNYSRNLDQTFPNYLHNSDQNPSNNKIVLNGNAVIWGLTPLAMMIIFGDGIHNFGDGLAIGATFTDSLANGISTSLAVFLHELPHELGDFAVLVSTGMGIKKAVIANFISSLTAFLGLYVGIYLGTNPISQKWILSVCAGIFLYVALTDMLSELKQTANNDRPYLMLTLKCFGIILGFVCMTIIGIYEHRI